MTYAGTQKINTIKIRKLQSAEKGGETDGE